MPPNPSFFPIVREFIEPARRNRPGRKLSPTSITVHNTGNTSIGAGAEAHSRFVRNTGHYEINGGKRWVSWHFTVDDKKVIQHLPLNEESYHAGRLANQSSISIETCMNSDIVQAKADENLAQLVAYLLYDFNFSRDQIKTHKDWTGKNCPVLLIPKWQQFLDRVDEILEMLELDESTPRGRVKGSVDPSGATGAQPTPQEVEGEQHPDIDHQALSKAVTWILQRLTKPGM